MEELYNSENEYDVLYNVAWLHAELIFAAREPADKDDENEHDPEKHFPVLVSTRSFLKFLNSHVVSTTTIACK